MVLSTTDEDKQTDKSTSDDALVLTSEYISALTTKPSNFATRFEDGFVDRAGRSPAPPAAHPTPALIANARASVSSANSDAGRVLARFGRWQPEFGVLRALLKFFAKPGKLEMQMEGLSAKIGVLSGTFSLYRENVREVRQ